MTCWVVSVYLPAFYIPHLICWGPVSGPRWNRGVTARECNELRAQKSSPPGRPQHICSTLLKQQEDQGRGWNLPITHTWHNHGQWETLLPLLRIYLPCLFVQHMRREWWAEIKRKKKNRWTDYEGEKWPVWNRELERGMGDQTQNEREREREGVRKPAKHTFHLAVNIDSAADN